MCKQPNHQYPQQNDWKLYENIYSNKTVGDPSFVSCFDFIIGQQLNDSRIVHENIALEILTRDQLSSFINFHRQILWPAVFAEHVITAQMNKRLKIYFTTCCNKCLHFAYQVQRHTECAIQLTLNGSSSKHVKHSPVLSLVLSVDVVATAWNGFTTFIFSKNLSGSS